MRLLHLQILLIINVVVLTGRVAGQDKESLNELLKLDSKSDTFQLKKQPETEIGLGNSFFMPSFNSHLFGVYLLPKVNFQALKVLKFDQNRISGNVTYGYMTLWNYNPFRYSPIGNMGYFGLYGTSIRQVNDKLYLGTSMLIPDKTGTITGPFNGNSFNSSIFVGYKFSEKFSIKAGMNIHRYDSPWMNGGYVP